MRSIPLRAAMTALILCLSTALTAQVDCLGVNGGSALPGTPCDDGLSYTGGIFGDTWNTNCACVGYCDAMWDTGPIGLPGEACNDANPNTINDVWSSTCICSGTCLFGTPGGPCDDNDPLTANDTWDAWGCSCYGYSAMLSGQVFLDMNTDGALNAGDMLLPNRTVTAGAYTTTTDMNGDFTFTLPGGFYSPAAAPGSFDTQAQTLPFIDLTVPGTVSSGHLIAMDPTSLQGDVSVHVSSRPPRPGRTNWVTLVAKNEGTQAAAGGTLTYTWDPAQTLSYHFPAGIVVGNTISWSVPTLQPGETFVAHAWPLSSTSAVMGTLYQYTAQVTVPGDAVPGNDVVVLDAEVINSWDPNDKQVTPALLSPDDIAAGRPVDYMIRFQNTGTASAIDVRISDALPIHVNVGSFVFLGSSHPCTTQIAPGGLLEFRFDGINLPDSTSNEPNSHGWVMFRMTPNSYLLPGAVVGNNANIFFDFNAPVLTNTATFEVQLATTVAEGIRSEELRLWPNPARDALNVALDRSLTGACHIALVDAQGRMVRLLQHTPNDRAFTLPLQGLATGLYNVRIKADGLVWNRRFVKE